MDRDDYYKGFGQLRVKWFGILNPREKHCKVQNCTRMHRYLHIYNLEHGPPISVSVGAVNFCVDRTIIVSQSVDSENISLLTINFDVTGW